jgi:AraC family transcriptional regulator
MLANTLHDDPLLRVVATRCDVAPGIDSIPEQHRSHCLAFVQRGSFGYQVQGVSHELVAGSLFVGRAGDEYRCTHSHHAGGDACLSFHFSEELFDEVVRGARQVASGSLPPLPELMVLGQLALAAADGHAGLSLDEAGLLLARRFGALVNSVPERRCRATPMDRKRVVEAALWLDAHAHQQVAFARLARDAGLSRFHFLRMFTSVLGLSPHQYLLRVRVRQAARLLAEQDLPVTKVAQAVGFHDLSNFVRTFRRAAGVSPSAFRKATRTRV